VLNPADRTGKSRGLVAFNLNQEGVPAELPGAPKAE
jgi:hypothetical protein